MDHLHSGFGSSFVYLYSHGCPHNAFTVGPQTKTGDATTASFRVLILSVRSFYTASSLKATPSTFTFTSTTRKPVMLSTASRTFC